MYYIHLVYINISINTSKHLHRLTHSWSSHTTLSLLGEGHCFCLRLLSNLKEFRVFLETKLFNRIEELFFLNARLLEQLILSTTLLNHGQHHHLHLAFLAHLGHAHHSWILHHLLHLLHLDVLLHLECLENFLS